MINHDLSFNSVIQDDSDDNSYPTNCAFVKSEKDRYITYYDDKNDTYIFKNILNIVCDYTKSMWYPPEEWCQKPISWNKIWSELDYLRTGIFRTYNYFPEMNVDGEYYHPRIQFHAESRILHRL